MYRIHNGRVCSFFYPRIVCTEYTQPAKLRIGHVYPKLQIMINDRHVQHRAFDPPSLPITPPPARHGVGDKATDLQFFPLGISIFRQSARTSMTCRRRMPVEHRRPWLWCGGTSSVVNYCVVLIYQMCIQWVRYPPGVGATKVLYMCVSLVSFFFSFNISVCGMAEEIFDTEW